MDCFPVQKQDNTEKPTFLPDLLLLSDSSVRLNLSIFLIFDSLFNPFHLYFSTIGPLCHVKKILGKFHFGLFLSLM